MTRTDAVIFDMGSVLIAWDCRPAYRPYFDDEDELAAFLRGPFREIYDAVHDGEGSMAECLAPLRRCSPQLRPLIDVYEHEWRSFVHGVMTESVVVVHELHAAGVELYGLTNWPHQVWPPQQLFPEQSEDYRFLELFEDVWVSGEHRLRKPDPRSYLSALERFGLAPERAVFVDDLAENVAAAEELGLRGLVYRGAQELRRSLSELGLLAARSDDLETSQGRSSSAR